jgi:IS30 family transposase
MLNSDEFKDHLPPNQIVPRLADQGRYVASESTLYRLLRRAGQMAHRRAERAPHKRSRPRAGGQAGRSTLQLGHYLPAGSCQDSCRKKFDAQAGF